MHIRTCVSEAAFCGLQRRRSNTYSSWKDEVYFNKNKISCSSSAEAIGLSCQKIVFIYILMNWVKIVDKLHLLLHNIIIYWYINQSPWYNLSSLNYKKFHKNKNILWIMISVKLQQSFIDSLNQGRMSAKNSWFFMF